MSTHQRTPSSRSERALMIEGDTGAADDNTAFEALDIVSHRVEALVETLVELIAETTTIADS